jgi:UDP-glucuronate 4-epimerase
MKILITGAAGFIGFHAVIKLLGLGHEVIGLDNLNDYYDVKLKFDRLEQLGIAEETAQLGALAQSNCHKGFRFIKQDIMDAEGLLVLFKEHQFDKVCNLAAQAGVRYSLENPMSYINSNIVGFLNVLEACRLHGCKHLVYSSSSSVYGNAIKYPFVENDITDQPESIYAATKKTNEMMAFAYHKLYGLESTGLRFFTVYGPWGRPDMAPMLFANALLHQKPIKVFNNGNLYRDFTYVDDVVEGIVRIMMTDEKKLKSVYNIGKGSPVKLMEFINVLEYEIGTKAVCHFEKMQAGDVFTTYADVTALKTDLDYKPDTTLHEGIEKFIKWYKGYYKK